MNKQFFENYHCIKVILIFYLNETLDVEQYDKQFMLNLMDILTYKFYDQTKPK